jgi:ArsR family transcriptional regulator
MDIDRILASFPHSPKKPGFSMKDHERQMGARVLKAMGHPIRLGVLDQLRQGEKTVGELQQELQCSQSMMSQQIQILEYHGLVSSRREATNKYCSLTNRDVLAMMACIQRHLHEYLSGTMIGIAAGNPTSEEEEP